MLTQRLKMIINSGKNPKWKYYLKAYARQLYPSSLSRGRLNHLLEEIDKRADADEIRSRAAYYCRITPESIGNWESTPVIHPAIQRASIGTTRVTRQKVYYHDIMEFARFFDPNQRINILSGDITYVPEVPTIVKRRPIHSENGNSVLLNLNKIRHFIFPNDKVSFDAKENSVLFRGKIKGKENRIRFMEDFYGKPGIDAGSIDTVPGRELWHCEKLTIRQQLRAKTIMALEGNDVASNLKWIMASNSLAVTPRMRFETWFMEGTLKGGEHYVEIADDFSDLEEKTDYYQSHPAEAREIIDNAHRYVARFKDPHREKLVSLLTLKLYFDALNNSR